MRWVATELYGGRAIGEALEHEDGGGKMVFYNQMINGVLALLKMQGT